MASFNSLQHTHSYFESPAKVFARLKSKVQMEAMNAKLDDFTGNNPLLSVREKHGAAFLSPWRKSTNTVDKHKENKTVDSHYNEAQALTLSPISSPQKKCGYSSLRETSPMTDLCGYKRKLRDGTLMESTAVSQPFSSVTRDQIHQRTPQIWESRVLSSRSPVKRQSVESTGRSVSDKRATPLSPVSQGRMFTPIKNRLRKKLDQQECNCVIRTTEERVEDARGMRRSLSTEDHTHNNSSILAGGLPADQSEMLQQPKTPQSSSVVNKRCTVVLERLPTASPAKMFAYMKERESKGGKTNVHNSRRALTGSMQDSDTSPSTARSMEEMEEDASADAPETTDPVNQDREDSAGSRSETGGAEDVWVPATLEQPILLEDPLVLNTPQISIPKRDKDESKRSLWINQQEFPAESVIYLKKWSLGRNPKGLFVTGIHGTDNILWNSSFIVDRVSSRVLKTASGRVYVLVGKIKMHRDSDLPKSFLKKFESGFPPMWKTLYEKMTSECKTKETRKNKAKDVTPPKASASQSVKRWRRDSFRTPDSCPPASSTKVSRSGRVIKPPLEYWRGGRITLDVDMNVTIHDCYDTSDTSSIASLRQSQKPADALQPRREDSKKIEKEEPSQLVRKVRAFQNQNKTGVSRGKKPGNSSGPTREMFEIPSGSTRTSSQRLPHTRRRYENGGLQKQGEPEASSTQRSQKQTDGTIRYSLKASSRNRISPSTENSSSPTLSDEEFPKKKRRQEKRVASKVGVSISNKTQPDRSLLSSKKREEEPKTMGRTRLSDKVKQKEEDENGWTKMELSKLQEAVSFYPRNITGFWAKVARMVGTRSAEECHKQHVSKGARQSPERGTAKPKKKTKVQEPKPPEHPVVSARVGTLKRKQQVRQFLEAVAREDVDDAFSSAYMQNQRVEVPSVCLSDEHEFTISSLAPQTPMLSRFPEAKTPQCLPITPGMIGSPNTKNDNKVVYQLQKKMKKNQFNASRMTQPTKFATPSVKRSIQRCTVENNNFAVWEMFPGNTDCLSDSDEQQDFYFSDT
uniref:MIS18 binding protein 1 n=1 Tax=Nothobranchius furzeri TaxID=105023 RepID=A0A1A8UTG9_NOTFU